MRVGQGEGTPHLGDGRGVVDERCHRRGVDPLRLGPQWRDLWIQHDQHRDELATVADRNRLADDRARLRE